MALGETGRAIVRRARRAAPGSNFLMAGTIGRLLEYLVSKILLIILVIAISNNSAALDQIVEGILP